MSLFRCENCKCIENTALCLYWSSLGEGDKKLCSGCDHRINKWHGRFDKEQFDSKKHIIKDGFVSYTTNPKVK